MSLEEMLKKHAEQDEKAQKEITDRLTAIEGTLKRYQGFVGGVVFIVSIFWLLLTQAKDLIAWLRG